MKDFLKFVFKFSLLTGGKDTILYEIPLGNSDVVSGSCGENVQEISIKWTDKNRSNQMNISFVFNKETYSLSEMFIILSEDLLTGDNDDIFMHLVYHGQDLKTSINSSFYSDTDQILPLTNLYWSSIGTIELSNLWFEAHNKIPFCRYNHTNNYDQHKDTSTFRSNCCFHLIYF